MNHGASVETTRDALTGHCIGGREQAGGASLPKLQPQSAVQPEANASHVQPPLPFLHDVENDSDVVGAQRGDGGCCEMGVTAGQASDIKVMG